MSSRVWSGTTIGVNALPVEIETHVTSGLPKYVVVGLPAGAVRESLDRVWAALRSSGLPSPSGRRITINLAPADVRKDGAAFDLPIALGLLSGGCGLLDPERLEAYAVVGELALDGGVSPVAGVLPAAINAAALVVMAIHRGFGSVVFANERSADVPTLVTSDGAAVNHQFAKSLEFERLFGDWVHRHVAPDLDVFSLLRRDRELAICRDFAALTRYHRAFSSCNRNFHLDGRRAERWCGACPKCVFVFLSLAPFMDVDAMTAIFGSDLLDDPDRRESFAALLALEGPRPFECVGEPDEARCAVRLLAEDPRWRDRVVVRELAGRIADLEVPDASRLLERAGPHRIPEGFAECV